MSFVSLHKSLEFVLLMRVIGNEYNRPKGAVQHHFTQPETKFLPHPSTVSELTLNSLSS